MEAEIANEDKSFRSNSAIYKSSLASRTDDQIASLLRTAVEFYREQRYTASVDDLQGVVFGFTASGDKVRQRWSNLPGIIYALVTEVQDRVQIEASEPFKNPSEKLAAAELTPTSNIEAIVDALSELSPNRSAVAEFYAGIGREDVGWPSEDQLKVHSRLTPLTTL